MPAVVEVSVPAAHDTFAKLDRKVSGHQLRAGFYRGGEGLAACDHGLDELRTQAAQQAKIDQRTTH